ncbi:hypothetical protein KKC74_13575, partial [bacterium]|nr:hypothetical protein [bacterium]
MKKNLIVIFIFVLILGCAGSLQRIGFDISLEQVERPKDAKERFGEVNTTVVDSLGKKYLLFEDNLVKAMFFFSYENIVLI